MKAREPRKNVLIAARVRADGNWVDAHIRNVSSRGMLLHLSAPPRRGTYLEIARGRVRLTARVAWSAEGRCGVQTREIVRLAELAGDAGAGNPGVDLGQGERRQSRERRGTRRPVRKLGHLMEFAATAAFAACIAAALVTPAYATLAQTMEEVRSRL